jgi:long-chain acyl-CoA synthetase
MDTNLGEFIRQAAEKYQGKVAFEIKRGIRRDRFTFAQMYDLGLRLATFLKDKGIKREDKVVILAPNMPEYVLVFFGSWIAGVIIIPIDTRTRKETLDKFVKLANPKLGFTSRYMPNPFKNQPFETVFLEDLIDKIKNFPRVKPFRVKSSDIAEIVFTSGTTGIPKGVVLTHENLLFDTKKVLEVFPLDKNWRILSILPLSHAFQQVVDLLACFSGGMRVVHLPKVNLLAVGRAFCEYQITCMAIVPQLLSLMFKGIKRRAQEQGRLDQFEMAQKVTSFLPWILRRFVFRDVHQALGGKFKFFVCGSAPLDLKLARAWENMGIKIYEGYGATEMTAGLTLNTPKVKKLGSVGKVLPEMEVKIVGGTRLRSLSYDGQGEIWARGENISPGYFSALTKKTDEGRRLKNPEKTAEVFINGWYRSGDVGFFDKEGFLYILGRVAFKIVLPDGRKVYPEDIEKKLKAHSQVCEACVVGVKREQGEVVHAVIITQKLGMLDQIVRETNRNLEAHQQILEASSWPGEDFPRTPILKIDRKKVLEWVMTKEIRELGNQEIRKGKAGDELVEIISEVSGVLTEKINEKTNLGSDLGLDSLGRVELVSQIEERLGVTVEEQKISSQTRVGRLRGLIKEGEKVEREKVPTWPFNNLAILVREFFQRFLVFPLHEFFVKIKVEGEENLDQIVPPAIFIFNHLGPYDAACVHRVLPKTLRRKLALLVDTRDWSKGGGVLGFLIQLFGGGVAVAHKGKVKRSGLKRVGDLVADGFSISMAPEGGFSKTGKLGEFKPGAGMLAVELGIPVMPIKIDPFYQEIFQPTPFGRWLNYLPNRRGEITVAIGKPLIFPKDASYVEATEKVKRQMEKL